LGAGRVGLDLNISGPGDPFEIDPLTLEADFGPGELPPYGEVMRGILEGEPALSVRGDMAVDCWRIIEPVLKVWRDDEVPLKEYPAGSTVTDGWPLSGLTRP
jgi:glucose-6-phosphate 1-dehydrogenase